MILYLIPILTALTLITAAAAIYQLRFRNRRVADRLHRVVETENDHVIADGFSTSSLPFMVKPVTFLAWLMPGHLYSETLRWDLARAGYRHVDARKIFAGLRVLSTAFLGIVGVLAAFQFHMSAGQVFLSAFTGIALGFYVPFMVLRAVQSERQKEIELALPDALDLLVICVEAGQGLNAALLKVSRELEFQATALSDELRTVNNEMLAGATRAQALRNFSFRTGVDDVRAFVAVMIQSDRFGTGIAQVLRVHAKSLREKRRQRAEQNARKAPVKLVFPLVFCIFPELLVVILAPGMLQLYRALTSVNG